MAHDLGGRERSSSASLWWTATVALGFGLGLGLYLPVHKGLAWVAYASALGAAALGSAGRRRLAWLLALMALGILRAEASLQAPPPLDLPMPRTWGPVQVLEVATEPEWTPLGHRFEALWLARCPEPGQRGACQVRWGRLRVDVRGREVSVGRGDILRVAGFTAPPMAYGNPGSPDRRPDWNRRGLWGSLRVAHGGRIAIVSRSGLLWNGILSAVGRARRSAGLAIASWLDPEDAAVVGAMALGDRTTDWPALNSVLRDSGTSHILAVSGSHLALVVGGSRWLLRWLLRRWGQRALRRAGLSAWTTVPLLLLAWTYTVLTGAAPSTVRSAWMLSAALLAEGSGRRVAPLELLGLAGLAMMLADPGALADLGLQLSVAGVLGLLWAASRSEPGTPGWLAALRATWAAYAATSPLTILRLGQLAWCAVPANLIALPYAAALLPTCLFATAAAWLPGGTLRDLAQASVHALLWPVRAGVAAAPGWLPVAHPAGLVALLAAVLVPLALAAWWQGGRWRLWAAVLGLSLAAALGWESHTRMPPTGQVWVNFLDVGHGDATLLRFDDGTVWLVDGGGEQGDAGRVGQIALLPALQALGIQRIDRLVLSHAHPDHENGLLAVVAALPIGTFWWTGQQGGGAEHESLMTALAAVPRVLVDPGSTREVRQGSARITAIWPEPAPWRAGLGLNDNSLVLTIRVGSTSLLLPGDIEAKAEAQLMASGRLRATTVLKVPHHGSRTSSTAALLDATRPQLAMAGARSYGALPFPNGDVRARYRMRGIPLWTTEGGMIGLVLQDGWLRARQAQRSCVLPTGTPATRMASETAGLTE